MCRRGVIQGYLVTRREFRMLPDLIRLWQPLRLSLGGHLNRGLGRAGHIEDQRLAFGRRAPVPWLPLRWRGKSNPPARVLTLRPRLGFAGLLARITSTAGRSDASGESAPRPVGTPADPIFLLTPSRRSRSPRPGVPAVRASRSELARPNRHSSQPLVEATPLTLRRPAVH